MTGAVPLWRLVSWYAGARQLREEDNKSYRRMTK